MPSNNETPQDTFFLKNNKEIMSILDEPSIMGILNVTPDSFFDGGKYSDESLIIKQASKMINDGAKIIDIGGYSSRPNANDVKEEDEINRIIPVISLIQKNFPNTIISIDTFRSNVAKKATENGAHIINDISGGTIDTKMFKTVYELDVPYILMHINAIII